MKSNLRNTSEIVNAGGLKTMRSNVAAK